jgi:hypothetical protein
VHGKPYLTLDVSVTNERTGASLCTCLSGPVHYGQAFLGFRFCFLFDFPWIFQVSFFSIFIFIFSFLFCFSIFYFIFYLFLFFLLLLKSEYF